MSRCCSCAVAAALVAAMPLLGATDARAARLKDIARLEGVRDNALVGYGVVVGLKGTGDQDYRGAAPQSVSSLLARLGVRVPAEELRLRNVAAVIVTAQLAAFAKPGDSLDVQVASIADARSLAGGNLVGTPLVGADGKVYAIAQGALVVGGFDAQAGISEVYKNYSTAAAIPSGGRVERSAPSQVSSDGTLRFVLKRADFTTAQRLATALSAALTSAFPAPPAPVAGGEDGGTVVSATLAHAIGVAPDGGTAPDASAPAFASLGGVAESVRAIDGSTVVVRLPAALQERAIEVLAAVEGTWVEVDRRAMVVVSERTGTVVLGADVRIAPIAIAHGGLEIEVSSTTQVSQPNALGRGTTAVITNSQLKANDKPATLMLLGHSAQGASVADLATALNALGATPRDLVVILQNIQAAGALDAELVVQ